MADIRQNPVVLADFTTYTPGTDLNTPTPNWQTTDFGIWGPMQVDADPKAANNPLVQTSASTWMRGDALDGDDQEVWAKAVGGGALSGVAQGLELFKDIGGPNTVDGYRVRWEAPGDPWILTRRTNGTSITTLGQSNAAVARQEAYWLLRRVGNDIEFWVSQPNDPTTWTQIFGVTDTTYMTGLRMGLSAADTGQGNELGWQEFGGGPEPEWHPEFLRRPWEYQGKQLAL